MGILNISIKKADLRPAIEVDVDARPERVSSNEAGTDGRTHAAWALSHTTALNKKNAFRRYVVCMERVMGIEPTLSA
ncbi:hypothetical protein, partial [Paenibacillus sp. AR247]|uniref:hypothetical protein n=1 Tax=Paenibacillus sp. AR247 TaxID=1631599 RepID=UPI000D4F873B